MEPVAPSERISVIDALRGAALAGIIVANMRGFNSAMEVYIRPDIVWNSGLDVWTQALIDCFVSGKFITIFAILFGLGFAIQLTRAADRHENFHGVWFRRLTILLLFGAAHVVLFWWGDILFLYAATGFLLLAFRNRSQERLMFWCQTLYWLPLLAFAGYVVASLTGNAATPAMPEATPEAIANATRIYSGDSFSEIVYQRFEDWKAFNAASPFFVPRLLGYFLFGLWLWREGVFQNTEPFVPRIRRWSVWLLAIGLPCNIAVSAIGHLWTEDPMAPTLLNLVGMVLSSIGVPALSLFYGCAAILLFHIDSGRRLLQPFTYVGRMALTNYILQSAICTWIFYGYGLGYFGQTGPLPGLLLALSVYAAQVVFSALWLHYFRYGPLEWLWRALTYLRPALA
jgi:uncharacterized protein